MPTKSPHHILPTCLRRQATNYKHQKGVALIITIILAGIMLTSVALFSKEMLDEAKNSTRIDNSLIAYYAAEAGIEEALLEFRYDRDAEISQQNDTTPSVDVVAGSNDTPRCVDIDLVTDTVKGVKSYSDCGKNFKERYYAVKMMYKAKSIAVPKILKDDVYEFEVPNMTQNVSLKWDWDSVVIGPTDGFKVEITVYDENGNILPDGKYFTEPNIMSVSVRQNAVGGGEKIIRIKPWYTKNSPEPDGSYVQGSCNTGTSGEDCSVGSSKEIPSISLKVNQSPTIDLIGAPITQIESVGYYGGVQRKITAQLDRTTGKIIGIFDFAIYSGSELVK